MKALWQQHRSRSARLSRGLGAFSLVLLAVAGSGHRFGLVETIPFLWVMAIVAVLALLAVLLALVAFARIWVHDHLGAGAAAAGLLMALIALAPFVVSGVRAAVYPPLTDISTDLDKPPGMPVARRLREPGTNPIRPISHEAALLQARNYREIAGRRYEYARDRVVKEVEALIAARGWTITGRRERTGVEGVTTIEAVARSRLLGFKSDVAIRMSGGETSTLVDMRSVSRYGRNDLGDNAGRINGFLSDLDRRMVSLAGQ